MALFSATSAPLSLQALIIPFVCLLIAFLGYGSQILFAVSPDLEPGPLTRDQRWVFNVLLACLWWTYYRACTVDPGRYPFPNSASREVTTGDGRGGGGKGDDDETVERLKRRKRWCRKCARYKPPRAHHCKVCRRCIPRMDHHCPWTGNCVSLQTFPHFLRFLAYTNISLWTLQYFLWQRFRMLWTNRHLPAYLGPTLPQLVWLTIFFIVGGIVALALGILGISTFKGWVLNMTMIEGWEVERHEAVLERRDGYGGGEGGFWKAQGNGENDDDDALLEMEALEFPYDIGFFANMAQGMGTSNVLLWFLPFASEPRVASNKDGKMKGTGWEYEENGLNDREDMWPPVDPEKVRGMRVWNERRRELEIERDDYEARERWMSPEQDREAFRRRQERDLRRWERNRREILSELEEVDDDDDDDSTSPATEEAEANDGQHGEAPRNGNADRAFYRPRTAVYRERTPWVNADGEQLGDYGVDEDAESDELVEEKVIDPEQGLDDEVPLAELVRRRKVLTRDGELT